MGAFFNVFLIVILFDILDPVFQPLCIYICVLPCNNTKKQHKQTRNTRAEPYFFRRHELYVVKGLITASYTMSLIYWCHRVVVPDAVRKSVLQLLHEIHQGASFMKAVAQTPLWWSGLDGEIDC